MECTTTAHILENLSKLYISRCKQFIFKSIDFQSEISYFPLFVKSQQSRRFIMKTSFAYFNALHGSTNFLNATFWIAIASVKLWTKSFLSSTKAIVGGKKQLTTLLMSILDHWVTILTTYFLFAKLSILKMIFLLYSVRKLLCAENGGTGFEIYRLQASFPLEIEN
jgi:hypothetical protein